jgi:hypothetical protein
MIPLKAIFPSVVDDPAPKPSWLHLKACNEQVPPQYATRQRVEMVAPAREYLAAVGYNFRRLIRWLRILLRQILAALFAAPSTNPV